MAGVLDDEARAFRVAAAARAYERPDPAAQPATAKRSANDPGYRRPRQGRDACAGRPFAKLVAAEWRRLAPTGHPCCALGDARHRAAPPTLFLLAVEPGADVDAGEAPWGSDGPADAIARCLAGEIALHATWTRCKARGRSGGGRTAWARATPCAHSARLRLPGHDRIVTLPGDPALAPVPGFAERDPLRPRERSAGADRGRLFRRPRGSPHPRTRGGAGIGLDLAQHSRVTGAVSSRTPGTQRVGDRVASVQPK
jgi:hypothetical protein